MAPPPPRAAECESHTCSICLEELALQDDIATTPCRHRFHVACLRAWQDHGSRCPLCNADLPLPRAAGETHPHPEEALLSYIHEVFTMAQCLFLDCMFVLFCLAVPALLFYAVLYLGKAALWLMLLDRPLPVNATANATYSRSRKSLHWSPDSVYFPDFFMGIVSLLMTGLVVTLCRACCCCYSR